MRSVERGIQGVIDHFCKSFSQGFYGCFPHAFGIFVEYNFFGSLNRQPAFFFHFLFQLTRFPACIANEKPDAIVPCFASIDQVFGSFKVSSPVDIFGDLSVSYHRLRYH